MHFGSTLRLLRIDAGMSLRSLAQRIGVSSAYLSRVENGHDSVPTPDRLAEIARVLGLAPAVLLDLANKVDPFVSRYLENVPAANALFLEIARRNLNGAQLARIQAFMAAEFPTTSVHARTLSPRLSSLLTPDRVILQLSCSEIEDVIDLAASRLTSPQSPLSAGQIAREIVKREREASTALGSGVAVPHAILPGHPACAALVTLAQPLNIPTPDNIPIRLLVILIEEDGGRPHLELLARVAHLANPQVADALCLAGTVGEALEQIRHLELFHG